MSLWDQDEAAYAAFGYTMNESGNYLIPDFIFSEIHRKPPLHFWSIAFSYKIFGVNEFAVRFPAALSISLLYLLVYSFVLKVFRDKKTALFSVVVLATSFFVPSLAKVSVTDATLLLFSTLTAVALYYIIEYRSFKWLLVFWAAFGLALLHKGPPIILFTGAFGFLLLLFHPKRKNLLFLHPWFFLPIALVPLFYWGWLCNQQDGGTFINWLIDWYILKRVSGSVLGQTGPPGTYVVTMLVFFLPYFMFFPAALKQVFVGLKKNNIDRVLGCWFIGGWLFFEFLPSKLPAYVVVAHIPLAILIARSMVAYQPEKKLTALKLIQFVLVSILYLGLVVAPFIILIPASAKYTFVMFGGVMFVLSLMVYWGLQRERFTSGLLALNILFHLLLWGVVVIPAAQLKGTQKEVAAYVKDNAPNDTKIIIGNQEGLPPSLPFYLYLKFKDIKPVADINEIHRLYHSYPKNIAFILNKEQLDYLQSEGAAENVKEIAGLYTDRKEKAAYYILIK